MCNYCDKPIYRRPIQIKRGSVYCSRICFGLKNRHILVCSVCNKEFRSTGSRKYTCSRSCANISRTGIKYKTDQKKSSSTEWRIIRARLILERGEMCETCKFSRYVDILVVHHKLPKSCGGGNEDENLIVVCPNCHAIEHLKMRIKRNIC